MPWNITTTQCHMMSAIHSVANNRSPTQFHLKTRVPSNQRHDLHIQTRPVLPGDILFVQIWTSYVKAFESYHLTDRETGIQTESTTIINPASLWVVNNLTNGHLTFHLTAVTFSYSVFCRFFNAHHNQVTIFLITTNHFSTGRCTACKLGMWHSYTL